MGGALNSVLGGGLFRITRHESMALTSKEWGKKGGGALREVAGSQPSVASESPGLATKLTTPPKKKKILHSLLLGEAKWQVKGGCVWQTDMEEHMWDAGA